MRSNDGVLARLHGASKSYGKVRALDGVDLALRGGELLALLGHNGAGKTTAIGLLLGLLRADGGTVELFGQDPQAIDARRHIGVMLQDARCRRPARGRTDSPGRQLLPRAAQRRRERGARRRVRSAQRPYGKLSGGQQRRVQFALALCGRPKLLFLDEPTVGMDIDARRRLWDAIRHLVAEGNGVVLTTHYLEEAEALADRVCVMARGKVISEGSVDALRARVSR
jgi:ABC-2 type transport system ATP-binding protein